MTAERLDTPEQRSGVKTATYRDNCASTETPQVPNKGANLRALHDHILDLPYFF